MQAMQPNSLQLIYSVPQLFHGIVVTRSNHMIFMFYYSMNTISRLEERCMQMKSIYFRKSLTCQQVQRKSSQDLRGTFPGRYDSKPCLLPARE